MYFLSAFVSRVIVCFVVLSVCVWVCLEGGGEGSCWGLCYCCYLFTCGCNFKM